MRIIIKMLFEKSAGAVIFKKENNKIFYLLLNYPSNRASKEYWGFPKGRVERGEREIEAAKREIEEETGLKDIEFIRGFKKQIKYFFKFKGKTIFKTVVFYLAKANTEEIKISPEHIDYIWLDYDRAIEKSTFQNAKNTLKKANDFLLKNKNRA